MVECCDVTYSARLASEAGHACALKIIASVSTSVVEERRVCTKLVAGVRCAVVDDDVTVLSTETTLAPARVSVNAVLARGVVLTRHRRALVDVMLTRLTGETGR